MEFLVIQNMKFEVLLGLQALKALGIKLIIRGQTLLDSNNERILIEEIDLEAEPEIENNGIIHLDGDISHAPNQLTTMKIKTANSSTGNFKIALTENSNKTKQLNFCETVVAIEDGIGHITIFNTK